MDTVDYTDAGVRRMKGIRHLSNWQLIIPLLLLTSYRACDMSTPSSVPELADSNKQPENPTIYTGQTAFFTWKEYEIQPFIVVEWYFENTLIAYTSEESLSQDDIIITPKYTDRFHLLKTGKVGFILTNVTKADTGKYSCIVTLKSTDIPKALYTEFQVNDSSSQTKPVSCCQGGTASFPWTDEIPPFRSIEWYFENTQLAETSESSFSQESLIINEIYKDRFHLHKPGNAGFNLTKVVKTDEGNYRCIITLQSTGLEFDWKLRVEGATGATGSLRKRTTSGMGEPFSCGKESDPDDADEQPPASDSSTDATIGIVVAACIVVTAVVVVIVIKRKRNSRTEQGSAGPDGNCLEETGPESHKLVVHEDQTRQPEGASPDSHEPIKQVDKTHQPDKQTCERMNLTQTC